VLFLLACREAQAFLELNLLPLLGAPKHLLSPVLVATLQALVVPALLGWLSSCAFLYFSLDFLHLNHQRPLLAPCLEIRVLLGANLELPLGSPNHPLWPVFASTLVVLALLELCAQLSSYAYPSVFLNLFYADLQMLFLHACLEACAFLELNLSLHLRSHLHFLLGALHHPNHPPWPVFFATLEALACLELHARLLSYAYVCFFLSLFCARRQLLFLLPCLEAGIFPELKLLLPKRVPNHPLFPVLLAVLEDFVGLELCAWLPSSAHVYFSLNLLEARRQLHLLFLQNSPLLLGTQPSHPPLPLFVASLESLLLPAYARASLILRHLHLQP